MAAFNVTALQNFGYNETTDFSDPMDPRWRAQPFDRADFQARSGNFTDDAIIQRVQEIALQQPYSELDEVEQALDEFYEENGAGNPNSPVRVQTRSDQSEGPVPRYRRFVL